MKEYEVKVIFEKSALLSVEAESSVEAVEIAKESFNSGRVMQAIKEHENVDMDCNRLIDICVLSEKESNRMLYKCECGFTSNMDTVKCPNCGYRGEKETTKLFDEQEAVYCLTMEDVDSVINNSEHLQEVTKDIPREELRMSIAHKMDIPWTEYIEDFISIYYK